MSSCQRRAFPPTAGGRAELCSNERLDDVVCEIVDSDKLCVMITCLRLVVHGSSAPAGFLVYAPTARGSPTIRKFRQRLFHDHRVVVFGLTDVCSQYMFRGIPE